MLPEKRDTERLTDAQISDLLELALESDLRVETDRLVSLPTHALVGEVRTVLERHDLGLKEASLLMGVNVLTLKSWLSTPKPLPEDAHQKLAAIGLLLRVAEGPRPGQGASMLVQAAVSLAKYQPGKQSPALEESIRALSSTYGPAGLMAAALHLLLQGDGDGGE
jgi:hypothetical protein